MYLPCTYFSPIKFMTGSRIDETGESPVAAAEPAWPWTYAKFELSIVEGENTIRHRGRMVALLFDIVP
jgi:hypothetical protein